MDDNVKNIDDQLLEFVSDILAEKDLRGVDEDVLEQMKEGLVDRLEDRINAALIENLPPYKLDACEKVLETNDPEKIRDFFKENIPDMEEVIAKELVQFKELYLKK